MQTKSTHPEHQQNGMSYIYCIPHIVVSLNIDKVENIDLKLLVEDAKLSVDGASECVYYS